MAGNGSRFGGFLGDSWVLDELRKKEDRKPPWDFGPVECIDDAALLRIICSSIQSASGIRMKFSLRELYLLSMTCEDPAHALMDSPVETSGN
jgi:hypothetical protein